MALPRARKLPRGSYRLTIVASDLVGNQSHRIARFWLLR